MATRVITSAAQQLLLEMGVGPSILAAVCGTTKQACSKFLRGTCQPAHETRLKIENALGVLARDWDYRPGTGEPWPVFVVRVLMLPSEAAQRELLTELREDGFTDALPDGESMVVVCVDSASVRDALCEALTENGYTYALPGRRAVLPTRVAS